MFLRNQTTSNNKDPFSRTTQSPLVTQLQNRQYCALFIKLYIYTVVLLMTSILI